MKIFILPFYNGVDDIFGSTCIFNSLRIGFPTSDIFVFDNSPVLDCRVKECAIKSGCFYQKLDKVIFHHDFIKSIMSQYDECLFLDPDIILYENLEEKLKSISNCWLSGFVNPQYFCEPFNAIAIERIHTSFFYVKSSREIFNHIKDFPFFDGFSPRIMKKKWEIDIYYDTCANLYQSLPKDKILSFDESILDCYTHLYVGAHLTKVAPKLKNGLKLIKQHTYAKLDPNSVRGIWREQLEYFKIAA